MFQEIKPNSLIFIKKKSLDDITCNQLISQFEKDPRVTRGMSGDGKVNLHIKDTYDIKISPYREWKWADEALYKELNDSVSYLRSNVLKYLIGNFEDSGYQIQKYKPGGFYKWHADGDAPIASGRQLVFMWYLNTVEKGGETEFHYQDLKIKPEKGKLVIFPPFWTHVHRSCVTENNKYICTGWIYFKGTIPEHERYKAPT